MHLASNLLSRFLVCIPGWFGACAFLLDLFPRGFFTGAFTGAFLLDLFPRGPCAVESHPLGRAAGGSPLKICWLVPKGNFLNVSVFRQTPAQSLSNQFTAVFEDNTIPNTQSLC